MDVIKKIRDKAKSKIRKIVLPEKIDERIVKAAEFVKKEGIADVVLLGVEDLNSKKIEEYAQNYYEMRKAKGTTEEEAREVMKEPLHYGAMMVREGLADGFVAGAHHTTASVARAAIRIIGVSERLTTVSSSFIMAVPNCKYGEGGVLVFADCGIVPEPTARQLAYIAISTEELARDVLDITPQVAMLSYSTKGSSKGRSVNKAREAASLIKELAPDLIIDGEMQVDAALIPEIALRKDPNSKLAGKANVLIFPNLDAGNIGYKLTERLANAKAIGPLIQGVNHPCCDLSRGCKVDDIVDCIAVTAVRAQNFKP